MPRFERGDRFWEIEREGRRLRIRQGKIGEDGVERAQVRHLSAVARTEFDQRIADKLAEGYVEVELPPQRDLVSEPSLEARLAEELDPDLPVDETDRAAITWTVLGDWLSARGDLRGELIQLDEALARAGEELGEHERERLLRRRAAILREWVPSWLGSLAGVCSQRGPVALAWDHGWLAGVTVGGTPGKLDLSPWMIGDLVPVLEELLDHPLTRLLRLLTLEELDPRGRRDFTRALAVVASAERPALCRLELGAMSEDVWVRHVDGSVRRRTVMTPLGELAALARVSSWAPRLRALRLIGRELERLPAMPQLRALEIYTPTLGQGLRESLVAGHWPRLERLWIRCDAVYDPWSREQVGAFGLAQLLDNLPVGVLRELGVQGPSGLLALLDRREGLTLDELRLPRLGDPTAEMLLDAADRFDGVRRIVVEDGNLRRTWPLLRGRFGDRIEQRSGGFAPSREAAARDPWTRWAPPRVWRGA